jgi:hypothetical protein
LTEQIDNLQVKHTKIGLIENKMNIFIAILLNFSVTIAGFSCSKDITEGRKNDPLPDARPEKLVVEYHVDGGMMYYSEALYISEDSSYYTVNDGGAISRLNFMLSKAEMDKLYKIFTDNNFDRIKTFDKKVLDRGGSSVFMRWGKDKIASVSNSGMSFVKESWQKEWNACESALQDLIRGQKELNKKPYEIRFDKTMFGRDVSVYINNEQVIPNSTLMAEHDYDDHVSRTVNLIPGQNRMSFSFGKTYESYILDADSAKGINFYLKNDSLNYSYIK